MIPFGGKIKKEGWMVSIFYFRELKLLFKTNTILISNYMIMFIKNSKLGKKIYGKKLLY